MKMHSCKMNKFLAAFIFSGLVFFSSTKVFAENSIRVTAPNSHETWFTGTAHPVDVSWIGAPAEITIFAIHETNADLFGKIDVIKNPSPDSHVSTTWTIPKDQAPGPYIIKISANYNGLWISAVSDKIVTIVKPSVTLNSPIVDQVVEPGAPLTMNWNYTGPTSAYSVSIQSPYMNAFETLATNLESTNYTWDVPSDLPGGIYKLLIQAQVSEASLESQISINNPELSVTVPNENVKWYNGNIVPLASYPITVAFTGTLSELNVFAVSQKDPTLIKNIDSQKDLNLNSGSLTSGWTIDPNEPAGPYKIKVSAQIDGKTITSTSLAVIQLEKTAIRVDLPTENSTLEQGQTYPILWTHKEPANAFNINVYNADNAVAFSTSTWATGTSTDWLVANDLPEGAYTLVICGELSPTSSVCSKRQPINIQPQAKITLNSPVADAVFYKGEIYSVSWTATGGLTNFWIDSYPDSDQATPTKIAGDITANSYPWDVSSMGKGVYKFNVCAMTAASQTICSKLQSVTIQEPSITFSSFDNNRISLINNSIKWTAVGMTKPIKFKVRRVARGVDYEMANSIDPMAGSLNWKPLKTIPDYISNEQLQIKAEMGKMAWTSPTFTIDTPPAPELSFYGALTSSPSSPTSTMPFTLSIKIKNDGIDPFVEGLTKLKLNIDGLEPDSCSMELNGEIFTDCSHLPIPDIDSGKTIPIPPITVIYDSRDPKRVTTTLQAVIDHFGTVVAEKENATFYIKGSPELK